MYLPQIIETMMTPQRTTNLLLVILLRGKSVRAYVCVCARARARTRICCLVRVPLP